PPRTYPIPRCFLGNLAAQGINGKLPFHWRRRFRKYRLLLSLRELLTSRGGLGRTGSRLAAPSGGLFRKRGRAQLKNVQVKIFGIPRAMDPRLAENLGAWALGFNFCEKSPRAISPAAAWKIRKSLAPTTEAFGVFVNWNPAPILLLVHAL